MLQMTLAAAVFFPVKIEPADSTGALRGERIPALTAAGGGVG
jgi:hypothetical protein